MERTRTEAGSLASQEIIREIIAFARAFVFDFDGTLVDSNEIKWLGFERTFADYPQQMPAISAYCRGSNHTFRGDKFRHVCECILNLSYTADLERTLHDRYAALTTAAVIDAPQIPGAFRFLQSLGRRPIALLSSTPHEVLLEILGQLGWQSLFTEVRGAPVDKALWIIEFARKQSCLPHEIVFFGDTDEDAAAATRAHCRFIRVAQRGALDSEMFLQDFTVLI